MKNKTDNILDDKERVTLVMEKYQNYRSVMIFVFLVDEHECLLKIRLKYVIKNVFYLQVAYSKVKFICKFCMERS